MSFQTRLATPEDFPAIVDLINAQVPEPTTLENFLRGDKVHNKSYPLTRRVAVAPDGNLAAYGFAATNEYEKKNHFNIRVRVAQGYRHQGAGQALYAELEPWTRHNGAVHLACALRDDDPETLAWAERRGFTIRHHMFESTLDLTAYDPTHFLPVVEQVEAGGIRLTTFAAEEARLGEEAYRKYYDLGLRTRVDLPNFDGEPEPEYDRWRELLKEDPYWNVDSVFLAVDGDRWAALSQVAKQPSGRFYNGYTCTDREYRGRKLALAVKVKSIEYVRSQGAEVIRTNNHSANAPMLAVNRKLGYIPCPGWYDVGKEVEPAN